MAGPLQNSSVEAGPAVTMHVQLQYLWVIGLSAP